MFYRLLGMLTWKAIRYYIHHNLPTKKIAAGAIVGTVGLIAVGAALRDQGDDT